MIKKYITLLLLPFVFSGIAQNKIKNDTLQEVIVSSARIDLPFKENSRTISIINATDIQKLGITNLADALQQVAGVDIRRRGTGGSQADLYIRGGGFDQTLLLIDGIKVDDVQTGHHTMNLALPIEVIERIEVIKGPAARVFGQNAFTGAVNIVTKKIKNNNVVANLQTGSFHQFTAELTGELALKDSNHLLHYTKQTSEGYRYNTDYDNQTYFLKSDLNKNKQPITLIAALAERNFGANGFYATPAAIDQYEATQASLVGLSTVIKKGNITWKPKLYWRRNQDEYIYIRSNPSIYRNLHISNKFAAEINGSYQSKLGTTGFGIETSKVYITSNNLGNHNRFSSTLFVEHRFAFLNKKLDITPGVAVSYFSDFKFHAFPGIDVGFAVTNNFKIYANAGYTYRFPTYTNLYYTSSTSIGNTKLNSEEAISEEIGMQWNTTNFNFQLAVFNRESRDLIDYVKDVATDPFKPENIQKVTTQGIETQIKYSLNTGKTQQKFQINYTFIDDDLKESTAVFSQYSINSIKHQLNTTFFASFSKNLGLNTSYRYVERTSGESYNLVDCSATYTRKNTEFKVTAINIFNEEYTETNLVPMPKGAVLFGVKHQLF